EPGWQHGGRDGPRHLRRKRRERRLAVSRWCPNASPSDPHSTIADTVDRGVSDLEGTGMTGARRTHHRFPVTLISTRCQPFLRLRRARRAPQRPPWINSGRIERQHLIVEFLRGLRRAREPVEVTDVLSRLFDNPWTVVVLWPLM